MRHEHQLEDVVGAGRGAGQDYRAGARGVFDGQVGGAVPVVEEHGVGVHEEGVEGCVAVGGVDEGKGRVGGVAVWVDEVGGGGGGGGV